MHFCSKFANCNFNWWWVMACTSSKWGKIWLWSSIWPWRSRSIIPQNNRALNQGILHLWSKCGDPSLNGWWVITRTNSWLADTRTHTHAGNDNTRGPKLASGKNYHLVVLRQCYMFDEACPRRIHLKMQWRCFSRTHIQIKFWKSYSVEARSPTLIASLFNSLYSWSYQTGPLKCFEFRRLILSKVRSAARFIYSFKDSTKSLQEFIETIWSSTQW